MSFLDDIHPGALVAFRRFDWTERDIAQAIVDGELTSPQEFENSWYFSIRISGTGASYRQKHQEFVWRDPKYYTSPEFLERVQGLPVIVEHPPQEMLNTDEFAKRVIGTIVLPFVPSDRPNECWGIARIIDQVAAKYMRENQLSTSPAVVFRDPDKNEWVNLGDGQHLLIEGTPQLIDHVCITSEGVWDKSLGPTGVQISDKPPPPLPVVNPEQGPDEPREDSAIAPAALVAAKADEALSKLRQIQLDASLAKLDSLREGHRACCDALRCVARGRGAVRCAAMRSGAARR